MAVPELLFAFTGHYEATGAYSFEFRERGGDTITEIFFMLPPENVSVSEPQRSALTKTLTGGYLADYGNEFKEVSVQGQSHFYYVGTPRTARNYGRSFEATPEDFIDGFSEFLKLRFMLARYRDYTMTEDSKVLAPDFSQKELADVAALKAFVEESVDDGDGVLADRVEVVWHDYDYDDHFLVKVDGFRIDRGKDDPWTIKYDFKLIAYGVDDGGNRQPRKPSATKKSAPQIIRDVHVYVGKQSPESAPDTLPVEAPAGTLDTPSTQDSVEIDQSALEF